jgi:3-oxoacyl-[acyl-carrier protein] reductase
MLLKNKIAVVTGANRGIGLSIAQTFLSQGAQLYACMRALDEGVLDALRAHAQAPSQVVPIVLDLAHEDSIKSAIRQIAAATGNRVDILVNNAATASGGLSQMLPVAELRRVFEINFFSQIQLTQGLSRLMTRHRTGSIINIASTATDIADPGTLSYGASKAALARASRSMASELGAYGVRVNSISPGVTQTDMYDQMAVAARDRLISTSAMKRAAQPQDIANVALFLASDLSSFVTGQTIRVDGGMV